MVRNLTDPDGDGTLEWQERVVDVDGDSVSIDLILDEVDDGSGFSNAADSNPSWLSYSTTTNTINTDETEVLVDITSDTSGLSAGYTYKFEITADDGITTTTRTFTLEITKITISGEKIYFVDASNIVTEADASTAFDITTLSENNEKDIDSDINFSGDVTFSVDGKWMYVGDGGTADGSIHEYKLSTAWDISTASLNHNLSVSDGRVNGIVLANDGQYIFHCGRDTADIVRRDMSGPGDLSNSTEAKRQDISGNSGNPEGLAIESSGSLLFTNDTGDNQIHSWDLGTTYDPTTLQNHNAVSLSDTGTPGSIDFNLDGTKMYLIDAGDNLDIYNLSTAWDQSTASYVDNNGLTFLGGSAKGFEWGG